MFKPRTLIAAVAAGTILIAGCSAGSTDYKKAAEKAINDSAQFDGYTGTCEKPASTDVGTTFSCTATNDADGSTVALTAKIDKKSHVLVDLADNGSDTTGTTVADGSTDTTVAGDTTETTQA